MARPASEEEVTAIDIWPYTEVDVATGAWSQECGYVSVELCVVVSANV